MSLSVDKLKLERQTEKPDAPQAGFDAVYTKSDGLYTENPAGAEVKIGPGGAGDLAAIIHAADSKTTPADADETALVDSATTPPYGLKKLTWANKKNALRLAIAAFPAHYERSRMWKNKGSDSAANRRTLVTPDYLTVNINNSGYILSSALELDLDVAGSWDTQNPTDYTVAANRAGKDFWYYLCTPVSGIVPVIVISANTTYPVGYSATTSRRIGQFSCECAAVGTISGHALTGYLAGDIIPRSIQDLKHRPKAGFIPGMVWAGATDYDSQNGPAIWVAIYLASGIGTSTASANGGTISDTRNWMDFIDDFAAIGCRMPTDAEFQAFSAGSNEETNITGSADPGTTGGHSDTAGRRTVSNIGCEDCCGVLWQWLADQSFRSDYTTAWDWYNLPGSKGSLYNQAGAGGTGDVKLLAGGDWASAAGAGSRSRTADVSRWNAYSSVGGRFAADGV